MDNIKLIRALEEAEDRLVEALRGKETEIKDYGLIVETLAHVRGLAEAIDKRNGETPYGTPGVYDLGKNQVIPEAPAPAPVEEPKQEEPVVEPEPVTETPAPEPAAEPEPVAEPEPMLTKDELKAKLITFANTGVEVAGIMQSMGFAKLSEVPESKYGELLDAVKKAAGEK